MTYLLHFLYQLPPRISATVTLMVSYSSSLFANLAQFKCDNRRRMWLLLVECCCCCTTTSLRQDMEMFINVFLCLFKSTPILNFKTLNPHPPLSRSKAFQVFSFDGLELYWQRTLALIFTQLPLKCWRVPWDVGHRSCDLCAVFSLQDCLLNWWYKHLEEQLGPLKMYSL